MKFYKSSGRQRKNRWSKLLLVTGIMIGVLTTAGFFFMSRYYNDGLKAINQNSTEDVYFTVRSGMSSQQVSRDLKEKGLIRSVWVFDQYVRTNELGEKFIAGTYRLDQSMSVQQITSKLIEGEVATDLFTIYPGSNLQQIKKAFLATNQYSEDQVLQALRPEQYAGHPALVDLPEGASLEGFLYPDSYHFVAETRPEDIIRQSLDEMARVLRAEIRAGISKQGLNIYQGIILASIVEREVGERGSDGQINDNRAKAAQVFIKRLSIGMKLESNATDGYPDNYDTYSIDGLPPEPISNTSASSLEAVAKPSDTDYLFFVSGSDCVTRFSATNDEHEALKLQFGIARPEDNCRG